MEFVVNKEQALIEVTNWLDALDYPVDVRTEPEIKTWIDAVVLSVQKGDLSFDGQYIVTQKLRHPLGDGNTTEIKYDFRFEVGEYQRVMKGKNMNESIDWNCAKLHLISKQAPAVFLKMIKYDYSVASKLALFF